MRRTVLLGVSLLAACGWSPEDADDDVTPPPDEIVIDASRSQLTVDRTTAVADGADAVRVDVRIVDTRGNPVAGALVQLATTGLVSSVAETNVAGKTDARVTSLAVGDVGIGALARLPNGAVIPLAATAHVAFLHGPPARLRFAVQPTGAVAGAAIAPFQVVVEDLHGHLVDDAAGTVTVQLAPNTNGVNAAGTTQVAIATGAATFDDVAVLGAGTDLRLLAGSALVSGPATSDSFDVVIGDVSPAGSTLTLNAPTAIANGASSITASVVLRNANGVAMPGQPIAIALDGSGTAFPQNGTTDAVGRFDASLTSVVAGTKLVTATSGGVTLTAQASFLPEATCRFHLPGLPDFSYSAPFVDMTVADFDEDGVRDYAVVAGGGAVLVLRDRGGGRLRAPQPVASQPVSMIATADVDGDGHADLVVGSRDTGQLEVHYGLGDGTFLAPSVIAIGAPLCGIIAVDLDGDGDTDLAACREGPPFAGVAVVWNLGTALAAPVALAGSAFVDAISAADVNNDGRLDVVTTDVGGDVEVFPGTPTGFAPAIFTGISDHNGYGRPAIGDYDGDGVVDIFVPGANYAYLAHGVGDGTFTPGAPFPFDEILAVRAVDLDIDGHLDVVATIYKDMMSGLVRLRGRGDGTFEVAAPYALSGGGLGMEVTDLDGDARPDVVVATSALGAQRGTLEFLRGTDAGFDGELILAPRVGGPSVVVFAPVAGDFDGNGTLDVVARSAVTNEIGVHLIALDGTTTAAPLRVAQGAVATVADFDRDGHADVATYESGVVRWLRGDGTGALAAPISSTVGGGFALQVAIVADFDGDLAPDLALATSAGVIVARGNADGTFDPGVDLGVAGAEDIAVADLDVDGIPDVIASTASGFVVVRGLGGGAFAPPVARALAFGANGVAAGDFDGDGIPDLAVTSRSDAFVSVFAGDSGGTFGVEARFNTGEPSSGVRAGDFDADGTLDLATQVAGGVAVLRGRGDRTFESVVRGALGLWGTTHYPISPSVQNPFNPTKAAISPTSFVVADFDGDGRADVMAPEFPAFDLPMIGYALIHSRGCL